MVRATRERAGSRSSFDEATSIWGLAALRADTSPDDVMAIDDAGRRLTFGDLRSGAERVAAGLADIAGPGSVVAWQMPTGIQAVVLSVALARLGLTQVPLLPAYRRRELDVVLRQTAARVLVVPRGAQKFDFALQAHEIASELRSLEAVVVPPLPEGDPSELLDHPTTSRGQTEWIFYTSGTTAEPKGARHSDRTILAATRGMCRVMEVTEHDRCAMVFPITHIGGAMWVCASLLTRVVLLMVEQFDPATTIPFLARERVTLAGSGTPFHLAYLDAQRAAPEKPLFPHIRAFPGGASPKPPMLHGQLKTELGGVGILSGYGLTECPVAAITPAGVADDLLSTTEGAAVPGVEIRVTTPDGSIVPTGAEGEIRVKGPQLFAGYVDPTLDAAALDGEGFLRTGDLGFLDAHGLLTITGRSKDVIIRKGENISAKELEDVLAGHPAIKEVAVVGLPDTERGELCCAVVVVDEASPRPSFDDLVGVCRAAALAPHKTPERFEFVDALPRNAMGKVLKKDLRTQILAEMQGVRKHA